MAELTETDLLNKIATIDAAIATLTAALPGGTGAAIYTDYKIGQLEVKGSQQLEMLQKTREMYQALLEKLPKEVNDVLSYDIDVAGRDRSDLLGDE